MSNLVNIGLIAICLGWIVQIFYSWKSRSREIKIWFLILYAIGVLLLVVDGYLTWDTTASLNLVSAILAVCVLILTLRKQKAQRAIAKKRKKR